MGEISNTKRFNGTPKLTDYINIDVNGKDVRISLSDLLTTLQTSEPKRYKATLTQTGTDPIVVTVLLNTFGEEIVWSSDGQASFIGTLAGAFPENYTYTMISQLATKKFSIERGNNNYIRVLTYDITSGTEVATDGLLIETSVEIEVYTQS